MIPKHYLLSLNRGVKTEPTWHRLAAWRRVFVWSSRLVGWERVQVGPLPQLIYFASLHSNETRHRSTCIKKSDPYREERWYCCHGVGLWPLPGVNLQPKMNYSNSSWMFPKCVVRFMHKNAAGTIHRLLGVKSKMAPCQQPHKAALLILL